MAINYSPAQARKLLKEQTYYSIIFIILFFFNSNLFSHTLFMKDLNIIYGIVYKQDSDHVYLNSSNGSKKIPKDNIAKILVQDIKDEDKLKKILIKVRKEFPQSSKSEKTVQKIPEPSTTYKDIEIESAKNILAEIEVEEKQIIHENSIFRSLVLPGWGHFYNKNDNWGYFFSSAFMLSLGATVHGSMEVNRAESNYQSTVNEVSTTAILINPNFRRDTSLVHYIYAIQRVESSSQGISRAQINQRNTMISVLGIYMIQVAHNYFTSKPNYADELDGQDLSGFFFDYSQIREPFSQSIVRESKVEYRWTF
ncbi:hypothetical protein [Leptospira sp. GIMC2001]|uniref:hypothetical protein n=1 Tax=Leptospira sp. GIMC2001 TaxID=1513297 RepID=UPI00234BC928|nr:hypothetical protein [Leptospira sp. GIMC2001]WCL47785.1 hypothetical protein O4O04_00585 [Leptospira sp. GIMC2001]